jgi:hypothetical protein
MNGVGLGRVNCVGRKDDQNKDQRVYPCVFERGLFPFSQEGACFPALRMWA